MTWLVFGVSCLLVLAGAVSITSGAPIIQLERGWAEVIAGSVAMSSGGVVFGLAVILVRLEALRDAMTAVRVGAPPQPAEVEEPLAPPQPAAPLVVPVPIPAEIVAAPVPEEMPPSEPAAPEPPEDAAAGGLWKRVKRPADKVDAALMEARGLPMRAPSAPAPTPEPMPSPEPMRSAAADLPVEPVPAVPSAPAVSLDDRRDVPTPEREPDGQLGWLERSLFKARPGRPGADDAGPQGAERSARVEPILNFAPVAQEIEPATGSAAPHEPELAPAETIHPADEGPTVIGRYQAGVASYVMYSDGTIEVETEGGQSHRFGSMDELKDFIGNQDQPAS